MRYIISIGICKTNLHTEVYYINSYMQNKSTYRVYYINRYMQNKSTYRGILYK